MNESGNTPKPLGQQGQGLADSTASKAQSGIKSAQQTTHKALDKASDKVDELKSDAAPMMDKLVQQGREVFNDTSKMVRDQASQAQDRAVEYAKDEPMKAILIAAATGAFLMGLISMMGRSRD